MPICEADPWRLQYFEAVPCPDHVKIPTEDADAYEWYPTHNWVYCKLRVALSQGLAAAPHGIPPPRYPVFSKPMVNLKGMGVGSRVLHNERDYQRHYAAGHMWMPLLEGEHVSTDCALIDGKAVWWRHSTGKPLRGGMFDYWTVHASPRPELEAGLAAWLSRHMQGYVGLVNCETIGGAIIEVHMRFADQWPDLYGQGWIEAIVRLYARRVWEFSDHPRASGYSVALFGRHGRRYRHPPKSHVAMVRDMPGVSSVQISFHEGKKPAEHAMPPGGFRLGIINANTLETGLAARRALASGFPKGSVLLPKNDRFDTAA
jgi:hypothetical protein